MSNSTSWRTGVCLALLVTALPAAGAAQGSGFSRGLRLGLAADLVSFRQETVSRGPTSMFDPGFRSTSETTGYGVVVPRLGLDVAGFILPFFAVGVRAAVITTDTSSLGSMSYANALQYRLVAYGEGRFVFTRLLALQVRAEFGVAGGTTWSGSSGGGVPSGSSYTTTSFTGGAQIGLHIHPVDAFSITPYFGMSGLTGGGNAASPGAMTVSSFDVEGFDVALGVALFGWIDLDGDDEVTPVSGSDFRRDTDDAGYAAATPAAATYTAPPAEPTGPSTEPVASGADWFVEFEVPGAQARAWANPVTSVVLLELRTSSDAARFAGCTEAVITAGAATAPMVVSVTPTRTLSAVEEQILMSGTPELLDILRADGARIELCGFTIELSTRARYALGRLRDRQRTPTPP